MSTYETGVTLSLVTRASPSESPSVREGARPPGIHHTAPAKSHTIIRLDPVATGSADVSSTNKETRVIYGYSDKIVNEEYGLLLMREVSFAMNPAQLRLIATFLVRAAEQLESGQTFLHRHIEELVPEWRTTNPQVDLIVVPEDSAAIPDIDS